MNIVQLMPDFQQSIDVIHTG